ncbi:MAG: hypothetical protein ABR567_06425 [Myxococcales bacterium]|nr:hypothetical protein [Myxococcales bacterium]
MGQGTIEVCRLCGGAAGPFRVRRALLEPFGIESLQEAVRWPFHRDGLLTAFACAVVLWILGKGGPLGAYFGFSIVLAVCFHVTRLTARGEDTLRDAGDFRGFFEDVIGPIFRASLAAVWAYGPLVAFLVLRHALPQDLSRGETAVAVLLLAGGIFLFPMALLAGALSSPLLHALNPVVVIGYATRLGRDYALLAGFALAISLFDSLVLAIVTGLDQIVVIPDVAEYTLLLLPALMLFRAMGLLVRARGDELGYGGDSSYLVPVLGRLRPMTELR